MKHMFLLSFGWDDFKKEGELNFLTFKTGFLCPGIENALKSKVEEVLTIERDFYK